MEVVGSQWQLRETMDVMAVFRGMSSGFVGRDFDAFIYSKGTSVVDLDK